MNFPTPHRPKKAKRSFINFITILRFCRSYSLKSLKFFYSINHQTTERRVPSTVLYVCKGREREGNPLFLPLKRKIRISVVISFDNKIELLKVSLASLKLIGMGWKFRSTLIMLLCFVHFQVKYHATIDTEIWHLKVCRSIISSAITYNYTPQQ